MVEVIEDLLGSPEYILLEGIQLHSGHELRFREIWC
jgi:hypothetical protein